MQYSMLENGMDFIISGILHLQKAESENVEENIQGRELKYALLHLSSGIELVFKSRLNIEHWTYIFEDMNKASKKSYKDGSLKTADSNTAIDRLEKLCDYSFDEKQKMHLKKLREARNRFEHGYINNNPKAIENIINNAVKVIVDFLDKNYQEFEIPSNMDLSEGLTDNERELFKKLTIECPECGEKFLRYADDDKKCECYFCGYSDESNNVAKRYIENILQIPEYESVYDREDFPMYTCLDCNIESLVKTNNFYFCFNCGMKYNLDELKNCNSCGKLFYTINDEFTCEACIERLNNKK